MRQDPPPPAFKWLQLAPAWANHLLLNNILDADVAIQAGMIHIVMHACQIPNRL